MWSPMSSTLIHGHDEAVLVDTLVTFDQVDALADWIDGFGKRLVGVYVTHGHSDHWIGLRRLRERFGDVPGGPGPKFTIGPFSKRRIRVSPRTGRASSRAKFRRSPMCPTSSRQPRSSLKAPRSG